MKITISVIKADIGSIGGHAKPSMALMEAVENPIRQSDVIIDHQIYHTGDDVAILMSHTHGKNAEAVHKLA